MPKGNTCISGGEKLQIFCENVAFILTKTYNNCRAIIMRFLKIQQNLTKSKEVLYF